MNRLLLRTKAHLRDATKPVADAAVGAMTIALLRTTRYFDPEKTANFLGRVTRFIGRQASVWRCACQGAKSRRGAIDRRIRYRSGVVPK